MSRLVLRSRKVRKSMHFLKIMFDCIGSQGAWRGKSSKGD